MPFSCAQQPDIAAPGVDILAAWVEDVPYRFSSGTSMECPHLSGIAAMLNFYAASTVDEYGNPIIAEGNPRKLADPFDYGGGHVNPNKAADPRLIYDMTVADHVQSTIKAIAGLATSCESRTYISDLNLPSVSISNLKETTAEQEQLQTMAIVEAPSGVKITVDLSVLCLNEAIKSATFKVTFSP
ncbi:Subtilisin-like protease SBT3-7 [Nymphaea thermarum]|nr:Subtilisin-like protease SBT3-7 [Nymphaea thermarum]